MLVLYLYWVVQAVKNIQLNKLFSRECCFLTDSHLLCRELKEGASVYLPQAPWHFCIMRRSNFLCKMFFRSHAETYVVGTVPSRVDVLFWYCVLGHSVPASQSQRELFFRGLCSPAALNGWLWHSRKEVPLCQANKEIALSMHIFFCLFAGCFHLYGPKTFWRAGFASVQRLYLTLFFDL